MRPILAMILLTAMATTVVALSARELRETVAALTAPELAGRLAGSAEERRAAEQIADWFAAAGLEPALADGWLQSVPYADGPSVNVLGVQTGRGALADRWLVVGAHLDHLGRVDPAATGMPAAGEYYPGAGDNASGVAVLRAVIDRVRLIADAHRSVLFCAFGAEEVGLIGSRHLAANLPLEVEALDAMINLDAVGNLGRGPLHVAGAETCDDFAAPLARLETDVRLVRHDPLLLGSDHLGFLALDRPALFFFTDAYPEMNSPADSLAVIDLAGLGVVAELVGDLVAELATAGSAFDFVPPAPVIRPEGGNRATWFGTAPDFSGQTADGGYLVGAVAEGGPAAQAGLQAGDIVLSLAGQTVSDLASFTQVMRGFDPGDLIEVQVRRGGKRLDFLVTLGDRAQRAR